MGISLTQNEIERSILIRVMRGKDFSEDEIVKTLNEYEKDLKLENPRD